MEVQDQVTCFIWMLKHDRLLTNYYKSLNGLGGTDCKLCGGVMEITMHALRDCPKVMQLGMKKVPERISLYFFLYRND